MLQVSVFLTVLLLQFPVGQANQDVGRAGVLLSIVRDRAHRDIVERGNASMELVGLKADRLTAGMLEEALVEQVPGIGLDLCAAAGRQPSGAKLALEILRKRKLLWWQRTRLICFRPRRTLTNDEFVLLKALAQDKDRRVKLELVRNVGALPKPDRERMWAVLRNDKDPRVRQEAAEVLGHSSGPSKPLKHGHKEPQSG